MNTSRPTRSLWIAGLVLVLGGAALWTGLGQRSAGESAPVDQASRNAAPPALTVNVVRGQLLQWPEEIRASGGITAWQEAAIGAEVSGLRLAELLVDVGDEVHKGQLLARFDDVKMRAMVRQQEAAVAEAEANVAEADANAQRAERLGKTGALSEQDISRYMTHGRIANAQLESARALLHSQRLALEYTRVVAPDDGVIASRTATLGSVAAPGTELFRLVRQNRLEWRAELSAAQIALARIGDRARVQLADGGSASGVVRQIAPVLDEKTRVGIVYVTLDGGIRSGARAGMYGSGTITTGEREALTIPASAITLRDGHEYVFVLQADGSVALTRVDIGRRVGNDVEITAGLDLEQQVVARGAAFLADEDMVRVVEADTSDHAS